MSSSKVPSYRLYRQGTEDSGDFWLHGETLSQRSQLHNWEISLHRHEGLFQVFVLQQGEGELLEGERRRPFSAPCAIYIAPGAVHGFQYVQGSEGLVFTVLEDRLTPIGAADPAIAEFLAQSRTVPFSPNSGEQLLLMDLSDRIHDEVQGVRPGGNLLLEAMVTELMLRLARLQVNHEHGDPSPTSRERDRRRMHLLMSLLSAHCREHKPVSFYAEKLGLSVPHLNRIARNEARASVQELAAFHLVRFAKRELVFTTASISSIAYALGFQDPAYFNRFFKRETGMTPGQYRELERRRLAGGQPPKIMALAE
ncbi:AraC family transcriptional regulator [Nitratireductor aestuarii]|uniref:AraC family transcriptional regulator n=1 Tax=Nitratireductor aestuarii TaxID=1735103 RepID=A0A916W641_9HYPH|nr:helix-turn-helix domain-containing protein [Nitratireductor aestuarii]GGA70047.1 AraC family transcriptional regulator [Nitratireductor aestuarii]